MIDLPGDWRLHNIQMLASYLCDHPTLLGMLFAPTIYLSNLTPCYRFVIVDIATVSLLDRVIGGWGWQ